MYTLPEVALWSLLAWAIMLVIVVALIRGEGL
jgi:hypothetical protein